MYHALVSDSFVAYLCRDAGEVSEKNRMACDNELKVQSHGYAQERADHKKVQADYQTKLDEAREFFQRMSKDLEVRRCLFCFRRFDDWSPISQTGRLFATDRLWQAR